jgi:hypothetical protein
MLGAVTEQWNWNGKCSCGSGAQASSSNLKDVVFVADTWRENHVCPTETCTCGEDDGGEVLDPDCPTHGREAAPQYWTKSKE